MRSQQSVKTVELDILNYESHQPFYDGLEEESLGIICAVGYLGDQQLGQNDFSQSLQIINTNFTGIVSLLNIIGNDFEARRSGFIVGISSVAGDRGRKSNYLYGSSKAAFTVYRLGLRN